jgi:hypothetical protein
VPREPGVAEVRRSTWRVLAAQIGGEYIGRRHQRPDTVQLRHLDSIITLDAMDGSRGTQMRAPFVNPSDFKFVIYDEGLLGLLGKKLVRLQDLDIGHPDIDRRFMVQSSRPEAVRDLFRNERVRDRVWRHVLDGGSFVPSLTWKVRFGISEDDGMLGGAYPPEVDVVQFETVSQITSVDRLVGLFELFKVILDHVTVPTGGEDECEREIRRLRGRGHYHRPCHAVGGRSASPRRCRPARAAGGCPCGRCPARHGAREQSRLAGDAVHALARIGDKRAIPSLIRLLGMREGQLKRKLCEDASDALIAMGEEDTVRAFADALDGRSEGLSAVLKTSRDDVIQGLVVALDGPGRLVEVNTVAALERISAIEALPVLRRRVNNFMLASVRDAYRQAIESLESRTSLPRPAAAVTPRSDTLPRPTDGATPPRTDTLPKATD